MRLEEAYDFEFRPNASSEILWQIENSLTKAMLVGKIVVRSRAGGVYGTDHARTTARLRERHRQTRGRYVFHAAELQEHPHRVASALANTTADLRAASS